MQPDVAGDSFLFRFISLPLLQMLMNHLWLGKSLEEAIAAPVVYVDPGNSLKFESKFDQVIRHTSLFSLFFFPHRCGVSARHLPHITCQSNSVSNSVYFFLGFYVNEVWLSVSGAPFCLFRHCWPPSSSPVNVKQTPGAAPVVFNTLIPVCQRTFPAGHHLCGTACVKAVMIWVWVELFLWYMRRWWRVAKQSYISYHVFMWKCHILLI